MKRRVAFLFTVFLVALVFFYVTTPVYAADETTAASQETTQAAKEETKAEVKKTEVDQIRLDFYYSGEVEAESDTKGVEVDRISGSKKKKNQWTTLTVYVTADDGYEFKRLNRSSAWKLNSDTSDLKLRFESASYEDDEAKVKIKYYYKDDTYEERSNRSYYYYEDDDRYYYFDNNNNTRKYDYDVRRYYDGWQKQSGYWYYYDNGNVTKNTWRYINGAWYHFNSNGCMETGWLKESNDTYYYLDPSSGAMCTGWKELGGYWYYFWQNGQMVRGWLHEGNNWYFLGSDGKMLTGSYQINGRVYRFKEDSPGKGMWLPQ